MKGSKLNLGSMDDRILGGLQVTTATLADLRLQLQEFDLPTDGLKNIVGARLLLAAANWSSDDNEENTAREIRVGGWIKLTKGEIEDKLCAEGFPAGGLKNDLLARLVLVAKYRSELQDEGNGEGALDETQSSRKSSTSKQSGAFRDSTANDDHVFENSGSEDRRKQWSGPPSQEQQPSGRVPSSFTEPENSFAPHNNPRDGVYGEILRDEPPQAEYSQGSSVEGFGRFSGTSTQSFNHPNSEPSTPQCRPAAERPYSRFASSRNGSMFGSPNPTPASSPFSVSGAHQEASAAMREGENDRKVAARAEREWKAEESKRQESEGKRQHALANFEAVLDGSDLDRNMTEMYENMLNLAMERGDKE